MEENQNNTEEHVHGPECNHDHDHEGHDHAPAAPGNPFANLSEDIQRKIQELQMMEQSFQQLLMQKNTFSMEINETEHIITEIEKTLDKLYNEGRTIIIASHDMDFIFKNVKRIIGLKNGKINFDGQKLDFFNNESLINDLKLEIPSVINWLQQKGYAQKNNFIVNKEIEEIFQNINMR